MMPVLFRIPGLGWDLPGYGLALMVGFLLSIMWAARRAERSGANPDVVLNCGFLALAGGVIGSRAMYVVHYWDQFAHRGSPARIFWGIVDVRKGGLEVYGGLVVVAVVVLIYMWRWKHSTRWYLDIIAPSAALGMAIGRIGCFVNGCCFGGVCDLPWAMRFPYGSPPAMQQWTEREPGAGLPEELIFCISSGMYATGVAAQPISRESIRASDAEIEAAQQVAEKAAQEQTPLVAQLERTEDPAERKRLERQIRAAERRHAGALNKYVDIRAQMKRYGLTAAELRALAQKHRSLPVHPAQLYSAITLGLLAALLAALYWRRTRDGQVICTMVFIEPWTRWMLEVVRADNPVDALGAFTISQFLGLCLSGVGLIGLVLLRYLPARSPRAALWEFPEEKAPRKKKGRGAAAVG